jgi:hypothetical protein
MEKYINDALKWFDENQNNSNARELFTNKIKETEQFFAPFYANAIGKYNKRIFFYFFLHIYSGNGFK